MARFKSDYVKTFIWSSALIGHLVISHMLIIKTFMRARRQNGNDDSQYHINDEDDNFAGYHIPGIAGASSLILYLLISLSSFFGGTYDDDIDKINLTRTPFLLKLLPSIRVVLNSLGIYSVYYTEADQLAFTSTMPHESGMRLVTLYLLDLLLLASFMSCSGLLTDEPPPKDHERDPEEEIWRKPLLPTDTDKLD